MTTRMHQFRETEFPQALTRTSSAGIQFRGEEGRA